MKTILLVVVVATSLFSCCNSEKKIPSDTSASTIKQKTEIKKIKLKFDLKTSFVAGLNPAIAALIEKIDSIKPNVKKNINCTGCKINIWPSQIIEWQEMPRTTWTNKNILYDEETRANINYGFTKTYIGHSYLRQITKTDFFRFPYENPNSSQLGAEKEICWFIYYGCLIEADTIGEGKNKKFYPAGTLIVAWQDAEEKSLKKIEPFNNWPDFIKYLDEQITYLPDCIKPQEGYEAIGSSITY